MPLATLATGSSKIKIKYGKDIIYNKVYNVLQERKYKPLSARCYKKK
jgi:hypothetical protein